MDQLWLKLHSLFGTASTVDWINTIKIAVEVFIVGYAIIWTWGRIRGTQAERLVKGVLFLTSLCVLSWLLGLTLITSLLQQLIPIAVVSLIVIFQPEIRRGLSYLGRTTFKLDFSLTDGQKQRTSETISHIISAVRELSRERTGALIVVEPPEGERDYLSPGTTINAEVSSNLLLSIFVAKSPLHDGAAVIRGNKVLAAGVILPITDNPKLSFRYGTRHRAALGLSEIYDGLCIVVSEETGWISAANRGMLVRYTAADDLTEPLTYFYQHGSADAKTDSPLQSFLSMFNTDKEWTTTSGSTESDTTVTHAPAKKDTSETRKQSFWPQDQDAPKTGPDEQYLKDITPDDDPRPHTTV